MADERTELYRALKADGYQFDKKFVQYSVEELQAILEARTGDAPAPAAPPPVDMAAAANAAEARSRVNQRPQSQQPTQPQRRQVPIAHKDPNEMAGQRLNTQPEDEPIRIDPDTGRAWFQEEVRKPATAKARGRRVLREKGHGVKDMTVSDGRFTETFEVPDVSQSIETEIKITLPSYQVGIYKDRRFPFKVICYNNAEGFKREDVENFYNGAHLVPKEVKRIYVSNVLCYDIRTTIQAIQAEDRRNQLSRVPQGGIFS